MSELLVTMAIILLVLAAVLSCHLFGMRLFEMTKAKLGASDDARAAISMLVSEVRSAKVVRVGNGSLGSFKKAGVNKLQVGNAIQIHQSTDTNAFVRYFLDPSDNELKRCTNGATESRTIAHAITNQLVFAAEDFSGNVLTNDENNRVIGLTLSFYQLQHPKVKIGPGGHYDFYQLRTRITRRTLE